MLQGRHPRKGVGEYVAVLKQSCSFFDSQSGLLSIVNAALPDDGVATRSDFDPGKTVPKDVTIFDGADPALRDEDAALFAIVKPRLSNDGIASVFNEHSGKNV